MCEQCHRLQAQVDQTSRYLRSIGVRELGSPEVRLEIAVTAESIKRMRIMLARWEPDGHPDMSDHDVMLSAVIACESMSLLSQCLAKRAGMAEAAYGGMLMRLGGLLSEALQNDKLVS